MDSLPVVERPVFALGLRSGLIHNRNSRQLLPRMVASYVRMNIARVAAVVVVAVVVVWPGDNLKVTNRWLSRNLA